MTPATRNRTLCAFGASTSRLQTSVKSVGGRTPGNGTFDSARRGHAAPQRQGEPALTVAGGHHVSPEQVDQLLDRFLDSIAGDAVFGELYGPCAGLGHSGGVGHRRATVAEAAALRNPRDPATSNSRGSLQSRTVMLYFWIFDFSVFRARPRRRAASRMRPPDVSRARSISWRSTEDITSS